MQRGIMTTYQEVLDLIKRSEDERLKFQFEADKRAEKLDRKLEKIAKMVGSIGNNQGDVAEEFFFNTLKIEKKIGDISFYDITANALKECDGIKDEYDILLTNGNCLAIVETKYKVHINDVEHLRNRKIPNFRKLFPIYSNYTIFAGIAGFHINEDVVTKAEEYGFFILKRHGKLVESDTEYMKAQ